MTIDPMPSATPEATDGPPPPARPRTVDWAVYAIFLRCLFSLGSGLLLFPYHDALLRREHDSYPKLTDAQVHQAVGSAGAGLFGAVLSAVVCLVLAKFIRDGKNWARWAFAIVSVLVFKDVYFILLPFVHGYPLLLGIVAAVSGLAALAAIVLTFLRPSMQYFREVTAYRRARRGMPEIASPLTALFRPRTMSRPAAPTRTDTAPAETAVESTGTPVPAENSFPAATPAATETPVPTETTKRPPRPKSRRGPVE